jgi:putative nucleotidyltransferase with HDIG domain
MNRSPESPQVERIAALLAQDDPESLRDELMALLEQPQSAAWLRTLDHAGLLTRIVPELEPARDVDQPTVHFLPVLAHSLETVAAVDWLFSQLSVVRSPLSVAPHDEPAATDNRLSTTDSQRTLPVAVQSHPWLRYTSVYMEELRAHFQEIFSTGRSRAALFRLAALLHDIAKPQTKQLKPGGVSFHEHQTIGAQVAVTVARQLRLTEEETSYIGRVVREHMRPGQLAVLDEVTLRAVRRFFDATADAGPDVLLHSLADHLATRGPHLDVAAWRAQAAWTDALLDVIWGEQIEPPRPLLNGDELMRALGIGPGPLVGRLLAAIGEAQAGGDITTAEEAILLARRLLRDA